MVQELWFIDNLLVRILLKGIPAGFDFGFEALRMLSRLRF